MKKLSWWPAIGLAFGITLAGCGGGGDDSSSTSVRVANATLTHPSIDFLVNSTVAASATATDTVSSYATPSGGSVTLQINDAGGATALTTAVPTLSGGSHYTLVAYESGGAVKTSVVREDFVLPAAGVATVIVFNAAIEAGKLDVYLTTGACSAANLTALAATTTFGSLTVPTSVQLPAQGAGSYNVCVTSAGSKTDLRLSLPITVVSQQVSTVLLTPASGGQLLNGAVLVQQGTYAATRNTNARVRLAAAVTGGATVAATASNGTVIDAGSAAPAFGYYTLVPASASLNISVNGASVGAPATPLQAGSDSTLLVYGTPGAPTATLLTDDNRPPTDNTTTKLRVVNGLTGTAGTITLTANSALVGSGILGGSASSYASVVGSLNPMNLKLSASSVGQVLSDSTNTLGINNVYSVLAAGDLAQPVGSALGPQLLVR